MARAIGIDIGTRTVKAVELSGSAKSFKIQRIAIREVPDDDTAALDVPIDEEGVETPPSRDERISAIVAEIFKTLALPKEDACATFPADRSMIREITVPFFEEDQIRKVVRFEAENHLHSHGVDDVVVNWVKTGETKDGSRLTVFASPKDDLADRIAVMRRAAVDPATIDLDATALFTALEGSGTLEEHPNAVVLDLGANSTNLLLIVDGRPRVFRSFSVGMSALESSIGSELGVPQETSRSKLMTGGGGDADDLFVPAETGVEGEKSLTQIQTDVVQDRRTEFVQKLHREAIRSLMAVRTESPPEVLLLTGGGSLVPGFSEDLAQRFGLPVHAVDFVDRVGAKDAGPDPAYAGAALGPAIGCALRMMGRNPLDIELLQDEFAPRNTFDVIRTALATALTLLFVGLAVLTYSTKQELRAEQVKFHEKYRAASRIFQPVEMSYLQNVDAKTKEIAAQRTRGFLKSLPNNGSQIRSIRRRMRKRHDHLESQLGLSKQVPQLQSAVLAMKEFYKALQSRPREELGGWFRISKMSISPRQLRATIIVDERTQFQTARQLLSQSEYFRSRAKNRSNVVTLGGISVAKGKAKGELILEFRSEDE